MKQKNKRKMPSWLFSLMLAVCVLLALGTAAYADTEETPGFDFNTVYSKGDTVDFGEGAYANDGKYTLLVKGKYTAVYPVDVSSTSEDEGYISYSLKPETYGSSAPVSIKVDDPAKEPAGIRFAGGQGTEDDPYTFELVYHNHTGADGQEISFTPWKQTTSLPSEAGNYYLTENVTLEKQWTVPEGTTNLCLNGHTIQGAGNINVVTVGKGAVLSLYDEPEGAGTITGGNDEDGGGVVVSGEFYMNGGSISGNRATDGGGVFIYSSGAFIMNAGTIEGNQATGFGGGVCSDGTFIMTGGVIEDNNTIAEYGGGVKNGGAFIVKGTPVIHNNSGANLPNDNVYLTAGTLITVHGLEEGADLGVNMKSIGAFTYGWKESMGTKDPADYFTSDNEDYEVQVDGDELKLAVRPSYTVTFIDGQGNTLYTETVKKGKAATAPATPTREGYTFDGWDKDFSNITSDLTVTAKWKESATPTPSKPVSIANAKVVLSASSFVYNGKVRKPSIKTIGGKTLKSGTDYTVKWSNTSSKNVGSYTVTITGKGNYTGVTKVTYKINPKGTSLKKPKRAKKAVTVKWKKQSAKMAKSRITGYQIQLATNKTFTKNKRTVFVKGYKKTSKKVKKLKAKKKYYIRIRTYKTVSRKNYYSGWSKVKTAKTR